MTVVGKAIGSVNRFRKIKTKLKRLINYCVFLLFVFTEAMYL